MPWIEDLLNAIPFASHYRLELEAMHKEHLALKEENARLKVELEAMKSRAPIPGRLEAEMEKMLVVIAQQDYAGAHRIGEALSLTAGAVDMYIDDLLKGGYIEPSYAGGPNPEYYLKQKGKRYLHSFGLL